MDEVNTPEEIGRAYKAMSTDAVRLLKGKPLIEADRQAINDVQLRAITEQRAEIPMTLWGHKLTSTGERPLSYKEQTIVQSSQLIKTVDLSYLTDVSGAFLRRGEVPSLTIVIDRRASTLTVAVKQPQTAPDVQSPPIVYAMREYSGKDRERQFTWASPLHNIDTSETDNLTHDTTPGKNAQSRVVDHLVRVTGTNPPFSKYFLVEVSVDDIQSQDPLLRVNAVPVEKPEWVNAPPITFEPLVNTTAQRLRR